MTNSSNDIIAPTARAAMPAITLTSPAVKWLFLLPPLSLCSHHCTWRRYALSRVPFSYAVADFCSGENYKTDGYVITPKTMELLEQHLKAVNGRV